MSQFEIETKWSGAKVSRRKFKKFVLRTIADLKSVKDYKFKNSGGPDYYFVNSLGYVARHRDSEDCKELTVKARVAADDIKIRVEHNIPLDLEKATAKTVHAFLRTSGYLKTLTITKNCDIYLISSKGSRVKTTVVWYEVSSKGFKNRQFIEVEVDHGSKKERLKILKMWTRLIRKHLGLKDKDICKDSLYEIYSNKRYLMVRG